MDQESTAIYDVKIGNEQRKAIDLLALKNYIDQKKAEHSLLTLDIDQTEDVFKEIARGAIDTIADLEEGINKMLGLVPETEPEEEVDVEPEIESPVAQAPPPPPPPPAPKTKPVAYQPAQPVQDEFDDQAEQEGEITL